MMNKSTVDEIRARFDKDVERFSSLQSGQASTIDAALVLEMISQNIVKQHPDATDMCDIGCGAGNFTLKVLQSLPKLNCTMIDLSRPMLKKAEERIKEYGAAVKIIQDDIRNIILSESSFDFVIAAAVLHHLRTKREWLDILGMIFQALKPGGTFWFWDLIKHEIYSVEMMQIEKYKNYLIGLKDEEYQKHVFDYIEKEDSPETSTFIIKTMMDVGFRKVDIIHKNSKFAAIVGMK